MSNQAAYSTPGLRETPFIAKKRNTDEKVIFKNSQYDLKNNLIIIDLADYWDTENNSDEKFH